MQDVIFNGSTHRKPSGRASVELVFDNSDGKASGQWGQYAEIAVKRTLTRDGTSTYYINSQPVRRRDIQDIFLGTGLGPRAYAIIGQGMISRIIESRPEELRVFLEEAAGVSKYKERRRETENRLSDTRENLLRVEDILRELNANLEKLEAQAAVAQPLPPAAERPGRKAEAALAAAQERSIDRADALLPRDGRSADRAWKSRPPSCATSSWNSSTCARHHFAVGDRLHTAQGALYQTNSEIGSLEAQIKFVIESRTPPAEPARHPDRAARPAGWRRPSEYAGADRGSRPTRSRNWRRARKAPQIAVEAQSERLPELDAAWREAQRNGDRVARPHHGSAQQRIELAAAHQRNAAQYPERPGDAARAPAGRRRNRPGRCPTARTWRTCACSWRKSSRRWKSRPCCRKKRPHGQDSRRRRNAAPRTPSRSSRSPTNAQLEARLSALKQLQERVQTQGKVAPWLHKHELDEPAAPVAKAACRGRLGNGAGSGAARARRRARSVEHRLGQGLLRRCAAGPPGPVRAGPGRARGGRGPPA